MLAPSTMSHPFEARERPLRIVKSGGGGEMTQWMGMEGRQRMNPCHKALKEKACTQEGGEHVREVST